MSEAEKIVGQCSCGEAYTLRGLQAPLCAWHNYGEDITAALAAAYKRGQEDMRLRAAIEADIRGGTREAVETIRALPLLDPPA